MPPKGNKRAAAGKAGGAMKVQSKSQKLLQAAVEIDAFVSKSKDQE